MRPRRVKISPGQLPLFVEKNFDNRVLLNGLYDFVTCQRADGSIYGNGGSKCVQGVLATRENIQKAIEERGKAVDKQASALLSGGVTTDSVSSNLPSKAAIEAADKAISQRTNELSEKMRNGDNISKELKNFIENRQFLGDSLTAENIVLGIEDGTPPGMKAGAKYDEFLARKIATSEYKNSNTDREARLASDAANTGKEPLLPFHRKHAEAITTITGDAVSPADMLKVSGNVAQVEARSMPSSMTGTWEPRGTAYAKSAGIGSRSEYIANYEAKMNTNATKKIIEAVDKNPNLKSVVLAQRGEITDQVVAQLSTRPGARSREFEYDVGVKGNKGVGQIIDPTGTGKPLIYNYGRSASDFQFNPHKAGTKFASETVKLTSGQTTPIKNPVLKKQAKAKAAADKQAKAAVDRQAKAEARAKAAADRQAKAAADRQARAAARSQRATTKSGPKVNTNKSTSTTNSQNKRTLTKGQKEQRKAQLEGLLTKAKADKNSGFIAQLEGMLKAL